MKIGIILLPVIFPYAHRSIKEVVSFYTAKYALDDVIPVAFKGTDVHMRCKKFPYHFGRNEDFKSNEPLGLCFRGLHSCWELDAVFDYYWLCGVTYAHVTDNRYFIALPEGPVEYGDVKMCSNVLNILTEIPRDMANFYHEELRNGKPFTIAAIASGLYGLVNKAVNEFIANNKDSNDYINLIPYIERNDI